MLVPQEDHLMLHQRIMHLLEHLVAHGLRHVHAFDLGAQGTRDRLDVDPFVSHDWSPPQDARFLDAAGQAAARPVDLVSVSLSGAEIPPTHMSISVSTAR